MLKPKPFFVTVIFLLVCFIVLTVRSMVMAQAAGTTETIQLTTYYPAPYGTYEDLEVTGTLTITGTVRYPVETNGGMTQFTIYDFATASDRVVTDGVDFIPPVIFLRYIGASTDLATGITYPPADYFIIGVVEPTNFTLKNPERVIDPAGNLLATEAPPAGVTSCAGPPRTSWGTPPGAGAPPAQWPASDGYYICISVSSL